MWPSYAYVAAQNRNVARENPDVRAHQSRMMSAARKSIRRTRQRHSRVSRNERRNPTAFRGNLQGRIGIAETLSKATDRATASTRTHGRSYLVSHPKCFVHKRSSSFSSTNFGHLGSARRIARFAGVRGALGDRCRTWAISPDKTPQSRCAA